MRADYSLLVEPRTACGQQQAGIEPGDFAAFRMCGNSSFISHFWRAQAANVVQSVVGGYAPYQCETLQGLGLRQLSQATFGEVLSRKEFLLRAVSWPQWGQIGIRQAGHVFPCRRGNVCSIVGGD